ncbi:MAG: methyl-accepting chemotaxis protein [Roseburia sp.]|nr:methyl-accepting chemotaxis protein [Roseburia sp.]
MKKKGLGIVYKLIGMAALPVMVLGMILSAYGLLTLKNNLKEEIKEGLKSAAVAVQGAYDAVGTGDFIVLESGNVIKGTFVVSGNYNLVDKLKKDSDIDAAIYYGEKPIVTSLVDKEQNRMLDLAVDEEISVSVLQNGKEYFSENVKIGADTYYGYYMPVIGEDGDVLGMIFTGKKSDAVNEMLSQATIRMLSICVVVIVAAVFFTVVMAASITKSLKYAMSAFGNVAEGNLAEQQSDKYRKRRDEIGDMIHGIEQLKSSLREIIGNIKQSSEYLMKSAENLENTAVMTNRNSNEVGIAIEEISKGAVTQAEDTENAIGHVEQMGGMIGQIVEDVRAMTDCANEMGRTGNEVSNIISELKDYTNKTTEVIDVIARQIQTTNASAQEIRKAVDMITSIADETNLLSLNASIEAARAGEQGRGFAVVADQIQKLADQSSHSAQQIGQVIGVLLKEAELTVTTMEEVVSIVPMQKAKLEETRTRFQEVNNGIQDSLERIDAIRSKSEVLDESRQEILKTVSVLSEISEENAAASEETTASTLELKDRVGQMTDEAVALKKIAETLENQIQIFQL